MKNGSTLEMPCPGGDSIRELMKAVQDGKISEADVDAKYAELSKQYGLSVELLRQQLPPLRLRHDLRLAAAQAVVVDSAKRK